MTGLVQERFWPVTFSVRDDLDLADLSYLDLFLLIMERLHGQAKTDGISLPADLLQSVQRWFAEEIVTTERAREWGAEAEAGGGISPLDALFAKARGWVRTAGTQRTAIRDRVRPRLSDLIGHCNRLIEAIAASTRLGGRRPLLLIEDLDKILDYAQAEELFLRRATTLQALDAHLILTVPIAIWYSPDAPSLFNTFDHSLILPSIHVRTIAGEPDEVGLDTLCQIVLSRVREGLIHEISLRRAARQTGGLVRDLFRVLVAASVKAQVAASEQIGAEEVERAIEELEGEYERSLASAPSGPTVDEIYDKLRELHGSPIGKAKADPVLLRLLLGGQILECRSPS